MEPTVPQRPCTSSLPAQRRGLRGALEVGALHGGQRVDGTGEAENVDFIRTRSLKVTWEETGGEGELSHLWLLSHQIVMYLES